MFKLRTLTIVVFLSWCMAPAMAFPPYVSAWEDRYPTSTLPDRMESITGSRCDLCHVPPQNDTPGNCYREDLFALIGLPIETRIDMLDAEDSDGDGVPNGLEATLPHADLPGEIGYNMGLIGPSGTNPCGDDPELPITGVSETPMLDVPAASTWSLVFMAAMLLGAGAMIARGRQRIHA